MNLEALKEAKSVVQIKVKLLSQSKEQFKSFNNGAFKRL